MAVDFVTEHRYGLQLSFVVLQHLSFVSNDFLLPLFLWMDVIPVVVMLTQHFAHLEKK